MPYGGSFKPTNLPYSISGMGDNLIPCAPGGDCKMFLAAQTTLNVGDMCYLSGFSGGNPQVSKSATLANYTASAMGCIVGGDNTYLEVLGPYMSSGIDPIDTAFVGYPACLVINRLVIVLMYGVAFTTAGVAIAASARVTASAVTAGEITTTGYAAGSQIAQTLDAFAGSGSIGRVLVNIC